MERRSFLHGVGAGIAIAGVGAGAASEAGGDPDLEEVEILRDDYDEPHVYADSVYGLGYGNGYAQAGDRLFQMDAIRHVGYGDSASVLGPGQIPSDVQVKRDLYSREEIDRQWDEASDTIREAIRGFTDGVNRRMVEMAATGNLPGEFAALGHAPEPWRPQDTVAAINYLIGFFGVSGGSELDNAKTLYRLRENLGSWEAAFEAYGDLNWLETTDDHYTSLTEGDVDVDGGETVPDSWDDLPEQQRRLLAAADPDAVEPWGIEADVTLPDDVLAGRPTGQGVMEGFKWGSNAVIVSGELSESGEPLLGGGPQMGYFKPPIPYEIGIHGAGYDVTGIGVTGAPTIVIGRTPGGEDADAMAWTITSGRDDMIDTVAVELDPEDRHRYRWEGEWHRMETRHEEHVANPAAAALTGSTPKTRVVSQEVAYVVEEGDTMPVVAWNPEANVAWCQRKTTRNDELPGAMMWAETAGADDLDEFEDTIREFPFTFNFHVVSDAGDIALYHTGKVPERAEGTDLRFPRSSSGHAWLGTDVGLGLGTWARNPERGYVVNWNNGPAPDWRAGDGEQNWGSIHRVDQLDRILREAAGIEGAAPESATDALDVDDVKEVIMRAALHDASAYATAPAMAEAASGADDPLVVEMGEYLRAWADAAADWYDDADGTVPLTDGEDDRYDRPGHAIYDDVRARLQRRVFAALTAPDEPGPDIDWQPPLSRHAEPHGTVGDDVTFRDALAGETVHDWFGGDRDEVLREALAETAAALTERFGSDDPADWLEPTHESRFRSLGGAQPTSFDMRNRSSYNQALDADGWLSSDEATWTAAAGDVLPPGNSGLLTADELVRAQVTGSDPDRLTNQLDLYIENEYKPHPATRTQVEQVATGRTTLRTVDRTPSGPVAPSADVSIEAVAGLVDVELAVDVDGGATDADGDGTPAPTEPPGGLEGALEDLTDDPLEDLL